MTSARSLSSQGCTSSVVKCSQAWASFTEGKSSLFQTFPLASGTWDSQKLILLVKSEAKTSAALCSFSFFSERSLLELGGGEPWMGPSSPGLFVSPKPCPMGFFQAALLGWSLLSRNPGLLVALLLPLRIWTPPSQSSAAKADFDLCPSLVLPCLCQIQEITFPCWLLDYLCQKHHQDTPEASQVACVLLYYSTSYHVGSPWGQGPIIMRPLSFVWRPHLLFLPNRTSIADTHYNSTHIRLPTRGPFQGKCCQKSVYKFL